MISGNNKLQYVYNPKYLYEVTTADVLDSEDAHAKWLQEEALAGLDMLAIGAINEYNECDFVSNRLDQSDRSLYEINQLIETKNKLVNA